MNLFSKFVFQFIYFSSPDREMKSANKKANHQQYQFIFGIGF
ncbi:hypothetical protein SAMN05661096_00947 [Marivirga sericea]|uniref:Uncharacterized protein n=1 Tax=Marivirga sericea TaxID=1028 RepID=A0A1X7IQG4_9BACT|nr:hypothetical protein SAMN05661096_00947 [Marivirga sericea]